MTTQHNHEAIFSVVERIIASGALGSGGRQVALLRYLVTEELEGRGDNLKAYSIGTDVLGRGANFDPAQDAIVRVEVGRLRKSLGLYFATQGRNEPVAIIIDKGTYRPHFAAVAEIPVTSAAVSAAEPRRTSPIAPLLLTLLVLLLLGAGGAAYFHFGTPNNDPMAMETPVLMVMPPDIAGVGEQADSFRFAFQVALAQELRAKEWLTITLGTNSPPRAARHQPSFSLRPYLAVIGERYMMTAILSREPGQEVVWTGRYEGEHDRAQPDSLQRFVAAALARDLASLNGPITESVAIRSEITSPNADTAFRCMVNTRRYLRFNTRRQFMDSKMCLTRLLDKNPTLTELRGILAYLLAEEAIYPHLSPLPVIVGGIEINNRATRREALLREAEQVLLATAPNERFMLSGRLTIAACRGQERFVREEFRVLQSLQTNNPDAHVALALLAGPVLGEWGVAISEEARAFALKASPLPWYQFVSAIKAGMDDDPAQALRMLTRVPMYDNAIGQAMIAAFGAEAGAALRVSAARATLARLGYGDINALEALIEDSCYSRSVKTRIKRGLFVLAASATPD